MYYISIFESFAIQHTKSTGLPCNVISHRSIVVIAEFNDAFGTQMMNFVFDYENKKWFKNGIIQSPNPSTKRFLVSISGQFFYMRIMLNETETYFENGLRKVKPYYFTFTTHAKV